MIDDIKEVDISRIEDRIIKENYVFALGFPQSSAGTDWIVLRAVGVGKINYWQYDPIVEGMLASPIAASTSVDGITNHTFITPQRPSSKFVNGQPSFIFKVEPQPSSKYGFLYQLFFGISPDFLRVLFDQPANTSQMGLPSMSTSASYNQFGTILGRNTPIDRPGKDSEIMVPPGLDFAIGFVNDTPTQTSPLLVWVVNYLEYEKVSDPDIIYEVLHTTKYKGLRTVGGLTSYSYSIPNNFGQQPLKLGMTKAQIKDTLGV